MIRCSSSTSGLSKDYATYAFSQANCANHITAAAVQKTTQTIAYVEGGAMTTIATGWNDGIF